MTDQYLPGDRGGEWGGEAEWGIIKGPKLSGVMVMFTILIMVIVPWVYEYVKMYQNYTFLNRCNDCMSTSIRVKNKNESGKFMWTCTVLVDFK